ncbi:flavin reductase family protein [Corynebacterium sp. 13CS0277]|uniref:flavin reductase family protein n=1 Tax=Corynebacterium sp. 13CS0277 TaxID=2071994 RepID=UPI001E34330A|nr:flavin reductase family protein [Corynebacterium sp. 13CS0277]
MTELSPDAAPTTVSGAELRSAAGMFPSGVTVVTTRAAGVDYGMTVSAFASLSLEPAMVLVSIESTSHTLPHLAPGCPVAVSVLSDGQLEHAVQFARHVPDRFAGVPLRREGDAGVPVLSEAAAFFVGTVASWADGGDHTIVTIFVEECHVDVTREPLRYHQGRLG